jgi:hypothetical protein
MLERLKGDSMLINQSFKKKGDISNVKYRVLSEVNFEDIVNADSNWQTLLCQVDDPHRHRERLRRGGRRDEDEEPQQVNINFWELQLSNDQVQMPQSSLDE